MLVMPFFHWDLSVPWGYDPKLGKDDIWQLTLTKSLLDNGWILNNKYLGAPGIAHWYANSAAQTSSLHSLLMLALSAFIHDAVRLQQTYFLLNFPLIALTSYFACRLLGIGQFQAAAVGLLYPFITYRFGYGIYAYLANYFMVPLALVPVYWTLRGDYASEDLEGGTWSAWLKQILMSRKFLLGAFFIALMALSDGYYSFFTLLLLGFAVAVRVVCGDLYQPRRLLAPVLHIVVLMSVALLMMLPLTLYKSSHHSQFYPNGVEDAAMVKHSFEAEVYSTNLKLLLAPRDANRISILAKLGQRMLDSSNAARKYPIVNIASIGLLASFLFIASFAYLIYALLAQRRPTFTTTNPMENTMRVSVALSIFIFLCATTGGIGALVALIYPSIRAYDRFALFLIFVLYLGGAAALTAVLARVSAFKRKVGLLLLGVLSVLSLLDQIPRITSGATNAGRTTYLDERSFVQRIERMLPSGAMVYNYPYSQFLSDSKYYGWGSFSQIRLYLHSHGLRWSNGAEKSTPIDLWHSRMAALPPAQLLTEMRAVGFQGIVIDRAVLKDAEYTQLVAAITRQTGEVPIYDVASKLAFAKLGDPGYRITYDPTFTSVERITITDRARMLAGRISRYVDRSALEKLLSSDASSSSELVIDRASHPEVFVDSKLLDWEEGESAIRPSSEIKGAMQCDAETVSAGGYVSIGISNDSSFDWHFNTGPYPIGIGVNLYLPDGKPYSWDKGIRLPGVPDVARGSDVSVRFPLKLIESKLSPSEHRSYSVQFMLVQDGNAWFNAVSCRIPINL